MLANHNSLTGAHNFDRVKAEGVLLQSTNFGVSILDRKDNDHSRFGFVISTKISKLATQRNRIKRAMREAVRQNLFVVRPGIDVVFLAKASIANKITDDIMHEVKEFMYKHLR